MKHIETKNKSKEELAASLAELRAQLTKLSFETAENKAKDSSRSGKLKRDIARVLTALNVNQ